MRRKISFLVGIGVVALFGAAWFAFHHRSNLEWMQRTTSVRLPPGVKVLSIYDNGEYLLRGHVLLPADTVTSFLQRFGFKPTDSGEQREAGRKDALDSRFMEIAQDADLFRLVGRAEKQTWSLIVDRKSGDLWFTVQYPDLAGDAP